MAPSIRIMCESGSETAGSNRLLLIDLLSPRVLVSTMLVSERGRSHLERLTLAILDSATCFLKWKLASVLIPDIACHCKELRNYGWS